MKFLLNINFILLDKAMLIYLNKNKINIKNKYIWGFVTPIKQDKINSIILPIKPIIVKKYKFTKYYEIIDGRHRFIKYLLENRLFIPSKKYISL